MKVRDKERMGTLGKGIGKIIMYQHSTDNSDPSIEAHFMWCWKIVGA